MGTKTQVALAAALLVLVGVCAWILVARPFAPEEKVAEGPVRTVYPGMDGYTMGQYRKLEEGMTRAQVDTVMDGGAIRSQSEIGGMTVEVYTYLNEDGSNVMVTFLDGRLYAKATAGF